MVQRHGQSSGVVSTSLLTTFGVFDAFYDEAGRQAHLAGPIAQALMANAPELLASPPSIEPIEVLGLKNELKPS